MLSNCFDESHGRLEMHSFRCAACATFTIFTLTFARSAQGQGAAGEIRGRIVDVATGTGVGIGSVAALRVGDSAIVAGAAPDSAGAFHIRKLAPGTYTIRVRVIGFAPITRVGVIVSTEHPVADVGNIALTQVATQACRAASDHRTARRHLRSGPEYLLHEKHGGDERWHRDRRAPQRARR